MAEVILYPHIMQFKTQDMMGQLDQLAPYAESADRALDLVGFNCFSLMGVAWDSVRRYTYDVQKPLIKTFRMWIDYQRSATEIYYKRACFLPDVFCLDEKRLKIEKEQYEARINMQYRRENPNYNYIDHCRDIIHEINLKLTAISRFIRDTRSLYDRPAEVLEVLKRADTQLSGVKTDPNTGEINYTAVSNSWLLELKWLHLEDEMLQEGVTEIEIKQIKQVYTHDEIEAIWGELQNQKIGKAELNNMRSHGYSLADVFQNWRSLETEGDKHFFTCLAKGTEADFMEAFDIDPNELSDSMTIVMSDYACHLLDKDQKADLLAMTNAMLSANGIYYYVTPDGSTMYSERTYRDIYIERLYAGTTAMLQGSTVVLSDVMGGDADNTILKQRYNVQFVMTEFWSTINIAIHRSGDHDEDTQHRIESIAYDKENKALEKVTMSYYTWYGEQKITTIEANQKNNIQVSTEWSRERIQALEKQKENLLANCMLKVIQGGANIAAGYVCPELAVLVSVANMGINGTAGTVSGADKLVNSELGKLGIKAGNVAASSIINYTLQMNAVMGQLDEETYKEAMEWFGSGSIYEIDGKKGVAFAGLYEPKLFKNMMILNNEGLAALIGTNPKDANGKWQINDWVNQLRMSGEESDVAKRKALCRSILNGEYKFMDTTDVNHNGIPEYKINLDSEYFDAIEDMDNVLKKVDGCENGIRSTFFTVDQKESAGGE